MTDFPVTGGDLFVLWHAAHRRLPEGQKIYDDALETEKGLAEGDEAKYGRPFTAWTKLLSANQFLAARTSLSIGMTRTALDSAIEHFKYVDGDNAKGLTAAGKDLDALVEKDKNGRDD